MGLASSSTESLGALGEGGGARQVLWEVLLRGSAHGVELRSVGAWENGASQLLLFVSLPTSINTDI